VTNPTTFEQSIITDAAYQNDAVLPAEQKNWLKGKNKLPRGKDMEIFYSYLFSNIRKTPNIGTHQ
jgi:hypothetical protein